jgi:hypothetical protein
VQGKDNITDPEDLRAIRIAIGIDQLKTIAGLFGSNPPDWALPGETADQRPLRSDANRDRQPPATNIGDGRKLAKRVSGKTTDLVREARELTDRYLTLRAKGHSGAAEMILDELAIVQSEIQRSHVPA